MAGTDDGIEKSEEGEGCCVGWDAAGACWGAMVVVMSLESICASSEVLAAGEEEGGGEGIREAAVSQGSFVESLDKAGVCLVSIPDTGAATATADEDRLGRGVEADEELRGRDGAR